MTTSVDLKSAGNYVAGRDFKDDPKDKFAVANWQGQRVLIPRENFSTKLSQSKMWQLDPNGNFTAGTFTANPILFRITPKLLKQIEVAFLEIVCTETGGANSVTPVVAPFLIDRIEIGLNGQPSPFQIIYAEHLYAKWQFFYNETINQLLAGNSMNMTSTAYAGESAIAASGTATYVIPIAMSLLDKINPDLIKSDIMINVYPRANPVSAGTGTLQLTAIRFRFHSHEDPHYDAKNLLLHQSMPSIIDYCDIVQETYTSTFTAATQVEIPLKKNGLCAGFFFTIRASKAVASSAIRAFTALGGTAESSGAIDLVNASKQSLLGTALTPQYVRYQLPSVHTYGDLSSKVPIYWVFLTPEAAASIVSGKINGGVVFTGNEYLRLTPGTGFSSTTYTVDVYMYMHRSIALDKGLFKQVN